MTLNTLKPVALAALLLSTSLSTLVHASDSEEAQDVQSSFNSNLDNSTQSHIISFLEETELLNVRATSTPLNALANEPLLSQIMPDLNSFAPTAQQPALNSDDQKALNNLFKNVPALQKSLSHKLDAEGAFLVHRDSAVCQTLMTPHVKNALKLTPTSLTAALEGHSSLFYRTIYAQVFRTAFLDQRTLDQWCNQSMLQHLASSFTFFERTDQKNNQSNASFLGNNIVKIGDMLISLKAQRSYVTFKDATDNAKPLTDDSFLLMSDGELADANNKATLEELLKTAPEANLILDAGQAFVNPFSGFFSLKREQIPGSLKHLTLTNAKGNATTIGENFLRVPDDFFRYQDDLESVDFLGLVNVRTIFDNFLSCPINYDIAPLKSVDFSSFSNVITIETGFLVFEKNVQKIDLSHFGKVKIVMEDFLFGTPLDGDKLKAQLLEAGKKNQD